MTIPSVDLDDFLCSDSSRKLSFVQSLGKAYEEVGFVAVKNHGISADLISLLYNNVQSFFSLPLEIKRNFEVLGLAGQRGYTSFGKEHAKGSIAADLKEFFQYGQVQHGSDPDYLPNVLVQQIDSFNTSFDDAYIAFEKSGKYLLQAIALYLKLDQSYFNNFIEKGNSILRAIHYPPISQEPLSAIRADQHEDINLITLLVGASADGLQILNKNNEWVSVTALPDQIVVNVGDMLQRLTNNKLKSTTHRVVNPSRDLWHTSRFSIPFFLHPKSSMSLRCLDNCITPDHPILYTDISAVDYLDERLKEICLKT
jgi:isopenicillin N synthase-like dioxygenase